jgi:MoxR-like ATPase
MSTLLNQYKQNIETILSVFKINDPQIKTILSIIFALKNGKVLLTGIPGTGKSTLVRIASKQFFIEPKKNNFSIIRYFQGIDDSDVIYSIDFINGNAIIKPRNILKKPFRYHNEFHRSSPILQNSLISYFEEREISFRDIDYTVPDGLDICDRNPDDIGSEGIVEALIDRFDLEVIIPANDSLSHEKVLKPAEPLSPLSMQTIWEEIDQIQFEGTTQLYAAMINFYFSACLINRSLASRQYQLQCAGCRYANEICKSLRVVPGSRGHNSLISISKAIAWFQGQKTVTIEDIEIAVPYVYSHRLNFQMEIFKEWLNPQIYLREWFIGKTLPAKKARWLEAIKYLKKKKSEKLYDLAQQTDDLVIAWLYNT